MADSHHWIAGTSPAMTSSDAKEERLSFEEAMERLDETGAVEAFEDWNAAVAASVMRYSRHTSEGR
ncbi:hypothetical protein [Methyloceanibacter sp.]|uniref:hypothetical protein n=1 Tax=Methyloceanibacter sp. TaxID=1965321 RepID=UPI003D6CD6FB